MLVAREVIVAFSLNNVLDGDIVSKVVDLLLLGLSVDVECVRKETLWYLG